ncbi:MAG: C40 family peptidase [Oscillospiraceae bacterium]
MKNNILIIIVVTLVAIGVIAAVIFAGLAKDTGTSSTSGEIPNWGGESDNSASEYNSAGGESSTHSSQEESSTSSVSVPDSGGKPISSSSASSTGSITSTPSGEFSAADSIVATASSLIGVPFVLGGNNPDGFDTPGFIYYVLRENGFHNCPRSIEKQSEMGRKLDYSELKAGDLVFFYNETDTDVGFGGIYIGDGKMIACLTPSNREAGVMSVNITTPYYQQKFYCGVSLS